MKKPISILCAIALLMGLFGVPAKVSALAATPDPSWNFKPIFSFEQTMVGNTPAWNEAASTAFTAMLIGNYGLNGSKAFGFYASNNTSTGYAYNLLFDVNTSELELHNDRDFTGASEFWMWVDFTGYQIAGNTQFYIRQGGIYNNGDDQYGLSSGAPLYIQSGSSWAELTAPDGAVLPSGLNGYKGFVRIPVSSFVSDSSAKTAFVPNSVYALYFPLSYPANCYGQTFIIDEVGFVGSSLTGTGVSTVLAAPSTTGTDTAAAAAMDSTIAGLPTSPAVSDATAISNAMTAYNALTNTQKGLVQKAGLLLSLSNLSQKQVADKAAADIVAQAINDLPANASLTVSDATAVGSAKQAYDALTADQKGYLAQSVVDILMADVNTIATLTGLGPNDPNPNWSFKTLQDYESFSHGQRLYSPDADTNKALGYVDSTTATNFGMKVVSGGYKNSNAFGFYGINYTYTYSQPHVILSKDDMDFTGAQEFWAFVDFSQYNGTLAGFRIMDKENDQYDGKAGALAYIQNSDGNWVATSIDSAGLFPTIPTGYRGFVRIPLSSLSGHGDASKAFDPSKINSVWLIFDWGNSDQKLFILDEFGFAGPSLTDADTTVRNLMTSVTVTDGDTAAAKAVEDKIAALPTSIDYDSESAITDARTALTTLTPAQLALVGNVAKLETAEQELGNLSILVTAMEDSINSLPSPNKATVDDYAAFVAVQAQFNRLTKAQQGKVSNANDLATLAATFTEMLAAIKKVSDEIDALPDTDSVTAEDQAKITAARKDYDALKGPWKDAIQNLDELEAAEAALLRVLGKGTADTGSSKTGTDSNPNTGDEVGLPLFMIAALISVSGLGYKAFRDHKKK